jgi:PRTRC genetic system protein E
MFFEELSQVITEGATLNITVRSAGGKLTVSLFPKVKGLNDEAQHHLQPVVISGTATELDEGFFAAVVQPLKKTCGMLCGMKSFEESLARMEAEKKEAKEEKRTVDKKAQHLNFEVCNGRLTWVVYRFHKWNDHAFYWMPVKFITLLTGKIREAAMSFMNLFIRKNGLCRFGNSYEADFFFEWLSETVTAENLQDVERLKLLNLMESYTNGEIAAFLNEVYDYRPVADMAAMLEECRPANPQEEKLLDMFRRGLPLISGDDSIMNCDYDPYGEYAHEEYDDCQPVTLDRMVRYVWDTDDFVASELEAMNNQCIQETYAQEPVSYHILDTGSKLPVESDYPERFSQWFLKMTDVIKEFTSHEQTD